jgi:undecaprenyl-phosphate galactose phosphotransferase
MKTYSRARVLLGVLLFFVELGIFLLLANLLKIQENEILLLAVTYFILLTYADHFNFISVLIWHEVIALLKVNLVFAILCDVTTMYLKHNMQFQLTVLTVAMFFITIATERTFRLLTRKSLGIRVLVLGAGQSAEETHILFNRNRFLYVNPVAYVSLEPITGTQNSNLIESTAQVIPLQSIEAYIRENRVDELYIADNRLSLAQLEDLTRKLRDKVPVIRHKPIVKSILPGFGEIASYDASLFNVITDTRRANALQLPRRVVDILVGLLGCLVLIPTTLLVKIGALLSGDTASIFFTQKRFGKDGKLIKIYKYRTMVPNAEAVLQDMMEKDPKIREEYLTNKKLDPDPRITAFGQILRKTSLDELPQLINILKGEMSLIGPRPYLPQEKEDMGFRYDVIVKFKPGLTGIWQASGRSNISFTERCKMDEYYYYNRSVWVDIMILVKTVKAVFLRDGAI